jgi:hypothetical protein
MLRASLLANAEILPQARRGSYFFNRIDPLQSFSVPRTQPASNYVSEGEMASSVRQQRT